MDALRTPPCFFVEKSKNRADGGGICPAASKISSFRSDFLCHILLIMLELFGRIVYNGTKAGRLCMAAAIDADRILG